MTWPLTLAGLPCASAFSKPHDYKQNVQKMKGLLKKCVLTGKQFEDFRQKSSKIPLLPRKTKQKNRKTTGAKTEHETSSQEKITEAKLKKAFRKNCSNSARLELRSQVLPCSFFYVISAGHDLANDAGRATKCRRNFKAPWLQTERTKKERPSKKSSFNGETVWRFQTKNSKSPLFPWRTKHKNHWTPRAKNEHETCSQEEVNWSKIERSFQNRTVPTLQD